MQLDTQNTNRSYLFGRLLAVMEMVERSTYDSNEKREPNAIRMQSVFCERPMYAARIIQEALIPYFEKLTPGKREYYRNLIGQIMELFPESDIRNLNQKLEDTYLLGYYLQRAAIKKYKKQTDTNENTEESCDGYTDKQN